MSEHGLWGNCSYVRPFAFLFCSKELSALHTTRYLEAQVSLTYFSCTKLATFAIVLTTVLLKQDVSPEQALILLGWMEVARNMSCGILPFAVVNTAEMYYALQRLQVGGQINNKVHVPRGCAVVRILCGFATPLLVVVP